MSTKPETHTEGNQTLGDVHALGYLASVAAGILEGVVSFPVRGDFEFALERRTNDRATLICKRPYSETDIVQYDGFWKGDMRVEGYPFLVMARREGKRMKIEFLDYQRAQAPALRRAA